MNKILIATMAFVATAPAAFASGNCIPSAANSFTCPVPEISALEGTAALAVVAALVLMAWERKRRAV